MRPLNGMIDSPSLSLCNTRSVENDTNSWQTSFCWVSRKLVTDSSRNRVVHVAQGRVFGCQTFLQLSSIMPSRTKKVSMFFQYLSILLVLCLNLCHTALPL